MKNLLLITLSAFITTWNHAQISVYASHINQLKERYHVPENYNLAFQMDSNSVSDYASGIDVLTGSKLTAFYIFQDSENSNQSIVISNEQGQEKMQFFSSYQSSRVTSFNIENNGTWIVKDNKNWAVFTVDMICKYGWKPIMFPKEAFDSIYLLDRAHFLTIKGNRKWHNMIDNAGNLTTNELFFEGTTFIQHNGGLIVPIIENSRKKYIYIQYQEFLHWDEQIGDNVPDPHFHFLKADSIFIADEIIHKPSYDCNYIVIKNNGKLQVYSFLNDSIVETDVSNYSTYDYGFVVMTDDYIASGPSGLWQRINLKNPIKIEFISISEDIINGEVSLKNGKKCLINLSDFYVIQ